MRRRAFHYKSNYPAEKFPQSIGGLRRTLLKKQYIIFPLNLAEMKTVIFNEVWYVYILKLNNGKIYTGCTNNLQNRLQRHSNGEVLSTKGYLPFIIATYICFTNKQLAFNFEKYLKSGSGRAFSKKHLY
jgi:putative endonuclease